MNFNQVLQIVQETAPFDKVIIASGSAPLDIAACK